MISMTKVKNLFLYVIVRVHANMFIFNVLRHGFAVKFKRMRVNM